MGTSVAAHQQAPTRRAVNRETTARAIRSSARELLVATGVAGVTLRPIARAVGLTAPALYRYYASREHLLRDLIADLYAELTGGLEAALGIVPADDLPARFAAAAHAFRRWAVGHPAEFELLFATPLGSLIQAKDDRLVDCGQRFGDTFLGLFAELWVQAPFPVQAEAELDPRLAAQLRAWASAEEIGLPLGALAVFLGCWVRIYGLICMELFGHLGFALHDVDPMFDQMLLDLARVLGLSWRPELLTTYAQGSATLAP